MFMLILIHIATGLTGIVAGLIAIAGVFYDNRLRGWNAVFLTMTAAACATGFVFLPTQGVTSAQLVSFFITFLLAIAVYARYARRLDGRWNQIYAITAVGVVFLNVLITTAQSFLHIGVLQAIAPTQDSPVYVVTKVFLLVLFTALTIAVGKRAGRS